MDMDMGEGTMGHAELTWGSGLLDVGDEGKAMNDIEEKLAMEV